MAITIKTEKEIAAMREGGKMLAIVLQILAERTAPGMTPLDMSAIARAELEKLGGEPAFLGFQGFPDVICISVNNQVQHSIPDNRQLQKGDVVNYDFGVKYKGMVTDGGISVGVGEISSDAKRLLGGTSAALEAGLSMVCDGCKVGDISAAIEAVLIENRLGIVRELVGHGVGHKLHEDPEIPNYGLPGRGPILKAGMTIAIEPIANLGGDAIMGDADGWTLWTADGSKSAQFEHTILVTENGYEILTKT
jgi:methionyl aminopeptidase